MALTKGGILVSPSDITELRSTLGVSQVDNTADVAKPVSTAQAGAIAQRASLTTVNNFTLVQTHTLFPPSYAATITPDGSTWSTDNNIGTLTGNLTLANPVGFTNAATLRIWLTQDGTGSRLITFGSKYKTPGGSIAANVVLSTAANAVDVLTITYNPTKDIWVTTIMKAIA